MAPLHGSIVACLLGVSLTAQAPTSGAWADADARTTRLPPSAFSTLSAPLRADLERRGCTIPQTHTGGRPHNVIRGQFRARGSRDVAVLCSRERRSTIVVFWNGAADGASEIAEHPDAMFLQVVNPGRVGFSRALAVASPTYIRQRQGDGAAPPIAHEGINDLFVEKGSVVWYWHQGTWHQLAGAD